MKRERGRKLIVRSLETSEAMSDRRVEGRIKDKTEYKEGKDI